MIELFPEGFEEVEHADSVELAAYTNAGGEERLMHAFTGARGADVEDGWEEGWRDFHKPVRIGRLWVGPPWETPDPGALAVVIDPGRAFGTGGHQTTRLCLELLLELPPGSLVDVGCGSGVVAIAAARLGFGPVVGLDNDPVAVEATLANAAENGVSVEARIADALGGVLPEADVSVANISLASVLALGPQFRSAQVVTSGYLLSERPDFDGYRHVERRQKDGWAADLYARKTQ